MLNACAALSWYFLAGAANAKRQLIDSAAAVATAEQMPGKPRCKLLHTWTRSLKPFPMNVTESAIARFMDGTGRAATTCSVVCAVYTGSFFRLEMDAM
jgi:hypothetical protein